MEKKLKMKEDIRNLKNLLKNNPDIMTDCLIKNLKIVNKFPPAKHKNKFIYGGLIEKSLINHLNEIPDITCLDLDKNHQVGSEYKNDCSIEISNFKTKWSIKASKSGDAITIINKNNKDNHCINNLCFIICHIKQKRLYIFQHNEELEQFIKETGASVKYKSSIFTYLKNNNMYYDFPETEKLNNFLNNEFREIESFDIYQFLYDNLDSL